MTNHFSLLLNDDKTHSLLEPPQPAFTEMTVKRAYIVWQHCGRLNEFKYVCKYFHYLEALEEKLSLEARVKSRLLEFNLLEGKPKTSSFLYTHFPDLYRQNQQSKMNSNPLEDMNFDDCVFKLEGFHKLKMNREITTLQLIKISQMIRKYCKGHLTSLRSLLQQFYDFTKTCKLENSVHNISIYIKKKQLKDELANYRNIPKNFTFLDSVDVGTVTEVGTYNAAITKPKIDTYSVFDEDSGTKVVHDPNKMKTLITEARREEVMNLFPEISELPAQEVQKKKRKIRIHRNFITSKIVEDRKNQTAGEFEPDNII